MVRSIRINLVLIFIILMIVILVDMEGGVKEIVIVVVFVGG